jgi:hypothetical protein
VLALDGDVQGAQRGGHGWRAAVDCVYWGLILNLHVIYGGRYSGEL